MKTDTFTVSPLEWVECDYDPGTFQAKPIGWWVYSVWFKRQVWRWQINGNESVEAPSKEAAMAACEQHWRSEIEPALVRVDLVCFKQDRHDFLIANGWEAFPVSEIMYTKDGSQRHSQHSAAWAERDALEAEIEKALPAAKVNL